MDLLTLRLMALGALGILAGLTLAIALGLAWLVEVRDRRRSRSAAPGPKEASPGRRLPTNALAFDRSLPDDPGAWERARDRQPSSSTWTAR
jgi:hypothetical protein